MIQAHLSLLSAEYSLALMISDFKKYVHISILVLDNIFYFIYKIEILLKTTEKLYKISSITCHTNCILQELILCYQVFYIKEMKSALSRLNIINQVFLASNVL